MAHVVRAFENPEVAFPRATIDPVADVEAVETELILSDLELVERRRDKTTKAARAGDAEARKELAVLDRFAAELVEAAAPARSSAPTTTSRSCATSPWSPTAVLFVLNTDDRTSTPATALVAWAAGRGDEVVVLAARLEVELAELESDEAAEFRAELGVPPGGVDELIAGCYRALGYITFFTGDFKSSESRAWQLPRGWTAWQAAGRIHGDIQKKFVRAEVVPIVDLLALGSFAHARDKGVLRVEGRDLRGRRRRRHELPPHRLRCARSLPPDASGSRYLSAAAAPLDSSPAAPRRWAAEDHRPARPSDATRGRHHEPSRRIVRITTRPPRRAPDGEFNGGIWFKIFSERGPSRLVPTP